MEKVNFGAPSELIDSGQSGARSLHGRWSQRERGKAKDFADAAHAAGREQQVVKSARDGERQRLCWQMG